MTEASAKRSRVSIAIPTYERGPVVVAVVERLLQLVPRPAEVLIVDQTRSHDAGIRAQMEAWSRDATIRWVRLPHPSVPHAMNEALRLATSPIVLFLDDDIIPCVDLVAAHDSAHVNEVWAVVGQILQPGEAPHHHEEGRLHRGATRDLEFPFNHDTPCLVENVMAGNLSVDRARALELGGFDEKFVGAAYRFETDFARRIIRAGGRIQFEPRARLDHLKVPTGGTRALGDHRSSSSPAHAVGDYYFGRRHVPHFWRYAVRRFVKNTFTRYHLRHPWIIPAKALGELRGLALGLRLARSEGSPSTRGARSGNAR
jgi:GT2 family glycosyltransferase